MNKSWRNQCFSKSIFTQDLPYSMPFSVSLTFTPGLVLKVVGMRATRPNQQHRNISAAGKEGQEHQKNSRQSSIAKKDWKEIN